MVTDRKFLIEKAAPGLVRMLFIEVDDGEKAYVIDIFESEVQTEQKLKMVINWFSRMVTDVQQNMNVEVVLPTGFSLSSNRVKAVKTKVDQILRHILRDDPFFCH